ncbi:hypothetical protein JCM3774_004058 [Rhodotorula dairenensis]
MSDDNRTPAGTGDKPDTRESTMSELFENLNAISFSDSDGDTDADAADEGDDPAESSSRGRTDSVEQSFHDTREQFARTDEASDQDGASITSSRAASTAEPPSPTTSTAPIVPRPHKVSLPPDEVVVPVLAEEEAVEQDPAADIGDRGGVWASPDQDHPQGATRSASTCSFSEAANPTYPPSIASKTGLAGGGANDPTLPVVATADCTAGNPDHVPPDGGCRAWANVVGGFLVLFASLGFVSAFGVFQAYFAEYRYTSHTESEISWIGSCQLCLFFLIALVAGPLFDRGRFRYLIGTGSVLWTLSVFLIPEVRTYGQAMFVQGIVGGFGVGLLFVPSLSVQSHWFEKRRALVIGLVTSGSSLGGICFPIMLNKLIANPDVGFANAVRAVGAVVAVCLLVANLLMSPHPARKTVQAPPRLPLRQIFTLPYTCFVIGAFVVNWGMWFPNFYVQSYFKQQGASEQATYYSLAIFNAGSFLGRALPGIVADLVLGPLNVQIICCLLGGITIYLMRIMTSQPLLILWAVLCGFFTGGFVSLASPAIVSISNNNLAEVGLRQGIAFVFIAGAAVGGNPLCGRLISNRHGDFLDAIAFAGTTVVVGALAALIGRTVFARQKGIWRV